MIMDVTFSYLCHNLDIDYFCISKPFKMSNGKVYEMILRVYNYIHIYKGSDMNFFLSPD